MNKPRRKPTLKQELHHVEFSNPRRLAVFHDWPTPQGPTQRDFGILTDDAGRERGITWTTGHKPRLTAGWFDQVRIVDGSNGRTYVVCFSSFRIVIYRGNLKPECLIVEAEPIGVRFYELRKLLNG